METELSTTLSKEIAECHSKAETAANAARGNIETALHAAADVGLLIDKAKSIYRGRLHEWLREHVPSLTPEQADVYHGIHRVRTKRECLDADTRQLRLIGIIGDLETTNQEGSNATQRADGSKWVKWCSHIAQHFKEVDSTRPIEQWESFERKALSDTLAPMVALYKRAGGVV